MRLLLLLLIISATSHAQELKLASDTWPPFTGEEGEKAVAMDLVKAGLERSEIESQFEIIEFKEVITSIDNGDYEGSAALWKNAEREEKYIFSKPYLYNQLVLVGRKGAKVDYSAIKELRDCQIAIVSAYAYNESKDLDPSVNIVYGKSDQDNLVKLLSKKVDYMLVDALLIHYLIKYQTNDVSTYLEIGKTPLMIMSLHFALRKNVKNAELIISEFDQNIEVMMEDGSYNEILKLNWIKVDRNGDGKVEWVLIGDEAGSMPPDHGYSAEPHLEVEKGYYINGQYYQNWEDVPNSKKLEIPKDPNDYYHEGGVILKF